MNSVSGCSSPCPTWNEPIENPERNGEPDREQDPERHAHEAHLDVGPEIAFGEEGAGRLPHPLRRRHEDRVHELLMARPRPQQEHRDEARDRERGVPRGRDLAAEREPAHARPPRRRRIRAARGVHDVLELARHRHLTSSARGRTSGRGRSRSPGTFLIWPGLHEELGDRLAAPRQRRRDRRTW